MTNCVLQWHPQLGGIRRDEWHLKFHFEKLDRYWTSLLDGSHFVPRDKAVELKPQSCEFATHSSGPPRSSNHSHNWKKSGVIRRRWKSTQSIRIRLDCAHFVPFPSSPSGSPCLTRGLNRLSQPSKSSISYLIWRKYREHRVLGVVEAEREHRSSRKSFQRICWSAFLKSNIKPLTWRRTNQRIPSGRRFRETRLEPSTVDADNLTTAELPVHWNYTVWRFWSSIHPRK